MFFIFVTSFWDLQSHHDRDHAAAASAEPPSWILYCIISNGCFQYLNIRIFLAVSDIFPIISVKMLSVFTYYPSASPVVLSISGFIFFGDLQIADFVPVIRHN
jgi:hypothetical protein